MTTAHNEHTGASLTTAGKGSLEKYAQGWEGIFGNSKTGDESCWEPVTAFDGGAQVPVATSIVGGELLFKFPTTVMALDFHDSTMYRRIAEKNQFSVWEWKGGYQIFDSLCGCSLYGWYSTEEAAWKEAYEYVVEHATLLDYDLS